MTLTCTNQPILAQTSLSCAAACVECCTMVCYGSRIMHTVSGCVKTHAAGMSSDRQSQEHDTRNMDRTPTPSKSQGLAGRKQGHFESAYAING